jgi:hypothetical protein
MAKNWRKRALAAEKARQEDYLFATVHEAEHEGLAEMARHLLAENSHLWDDWSEEHALALKWRKRARTEKADRKRCQEDLVVLRQSSVVAHNATNEHLAKINALSEREATTPNKVEELRTELLRAETELARVQGVCESTQGQVVKHAATIADLRERDRVSGQNFRAVMSERGALLAWQRAVREAFKSDGKWVTDTLAALEELRRAIEAEPKEET